MYAWRSAVFSPATQESSPCEWRVLPACAPLCPSLNRCTCLYPDVCISCTYNLDWVRRGRETHLSMVVTTLNIGTMCSVCREESGDPTRTADITHVATYGALGGSLRKQNSGRLVCCGSRPHSHRCDSQNRMLQFAKNSWIFAISTPNQPDL